MQKSRRGISRQNGVLGYRDTHRVRDLLVATQEEAQVFKQSVENGADFEKIIRDHTLRKGRKKGVYRVFALQANQYGTAWMNYVLNVPIGTLQGPIQAEGGYSILEVVERVADDHYSLEESSGSFRRYSRCAAG